MKPPAYIQPALYPDGPPDKVPAFVLEIPAAKIVRVWHADGPLHNNAQRCIARYVAKGWRVETVWSKDDLLAPLSVPLTRRAA